MSVKSGRISLMIAMLVVVIAIIIIPGSFKFYRYVGTGHEFYKISKAEGLRLDEMDDAALVQYIARAESQGLKYAFFMTSGSHIPFFLITLFTIGLLTTSVSSTFRTVIRLSFFAVWLLGMLFLSLGVGYYQDIQFPQSLGSVFLIYVVVGAFFIAIIVIVNRFRKRKTTQVKQE